MMHEFRACYSVLEDGRGQHAVHCMLGLKHIDARGCTVQCDKID
jgi:hypothetical protein